MGEPGQAQAMQNVPSGTWDLKAGNTIQPSRLLPPIAAYDAFAPFYKAYAEKRKPYLRKIEDLVIARAARNGSLLDVGAGDGSRALRIAREANLARVVLLEASTKMRAQCPQNIEIWPCSLLEAPDQGPQFEIITCLWNVLGHVKGAQQRMFALSRMKKLLAPQGMIFLDVNHRYNATSYGWGKVFLRMANDFCRRSEKHGDVIVSWNAGGQIVRTRSHVFSHGEMKRLFDLAGLKILKRWIINYETGSEHKLPLCGQLLYQLAAA